MELFDINKILPALLGGGILGTAAGLRYLCNGRILGISGIYGGLLRGEQGTSWRFTFTAGMLLGGLILRNSMPSAFYPISGDFPLSRLIGGGLLVGTGASLGSGCTSGHGVMGLSRLSVRSLVYVCTFMAAGAVVATSVGSAVALTKNLGPSSSPSNAQETLEFSLKSLTAVAVSFFGLTMAAQSGSPSVREGLALALELVSGIATGLALGVGGMLQAKNVAAFLDLRHWDPTLMFVMGGAIMVALPVVQLAVMPRINAGAAKENEPLVASSTNDKGPSAEAPTEKMPLVATNKYVVVTNTTIDAKLILGGVLFGAGWGLSGMCPGPGLINLATPVGFLPVLAFNAAMAAALALTPAATRLLGFA